MVILGLLGAAGAGKSTAAKYLCERYGATRFSFADPLKDMVKAAFDLTEAQVRGTQAEKEAIDPRYNVSPRWLLQRIGTEGCRNTFGQNFWTERTLERIRGFHGIDRTTNHSLAPTLAVIDDVRFANEAREVRRAGGTIWRLECPDRQSAADSGHSSEAEWVGAPYDQVLSARLSEDSVDLKRAVDAAVMNNSEIATATGKFREVCRCGALRDDWWAKHLSRCGDEGGPLWVLEAV